MARSPDVVSALAEVLARACVGESIAGDAGLARRLARQLDPSGESREMFAVGALGAWAAFGPDGQFPEASVREVVDLARALLRTDVPVEERVLTCASLGLLARRGVTGMEALDFLNVADSARRIEQHGLALWAARRALDSRDQLTDSHRTLALLIVAVVTHEPGVIEEAYVSAAALDEGDIARRAADALAPTLRNGVSMTEVGESVSRRDRRGAARGLAAVFSELLRSTQDALLTGLHEAFAAMSEPDLDVERIRSALTAVVGHVRGRQRFGEIPGAARAGVDMVVDLLGLEADPAAANVLVEFVEALADAGLSEVAGLSGEDPATVQAQLAYMAASSPIWPDLESCVAGLRGRDGLLVRQQRSLSTGRPTFLAVYVTPPDSVAWKAVNLSDPQVEVLAVLASGDPDLLDRLTLEQVDELVTSFLPRGLIERAAAGQVGSLVVVPDGDAWSMPWQLPNALAHVQVTLSPSLGVHARLPLAPRSVTSITAVVDDDAPHADIVSDALHDLRATGFPVFVRDRLDEVNSSGDLLFTYTHGVGVGLGFTAGTQGRPFTALALAASRFQQVIVAACWSSGAPPTAYPLNLPAALLLNQTSTVVGGLWPLPAVDTARMMAAAIKAIGEGADVRSAVSSARAQAAPTVLARWGVAIHGGPAEP